MYTSAKELSDECEVKPQLLLYLQQTDQKIYSVATNVWGQLASLLHPEDWEASGHKDVLARSLLFLFVLAYMCNLHLVLTRQTEILYLAMDGVSDFWER